MATKEKVMINKVVNKKSRFSFLKKDWQLYLLLAAPIIYLVIFKYLPMAGNIIAFKRFIPGGSIFGDQWVGLYYFKMFLNDPTFYKVFFNTLILAFWMLVITFPAPIILALLLNEVKNRTFKRFVQTTSYLPHFFSVVVVAGIVFEIVSVNGPINTIIEFFTGNRFNLIQMPEMFRTIFISAELWQGLGWGTILYLAALTGINEELYESAKIDGANRWKQTLHITLPGMLPTIVVLLILNIGNFLNVSAKYSTPSNDCSVL